MSLKKPYAAIIVLWKLDENEELEILVAPRKKEPNNIGLPGGKLENDEDSVHAALREFYEETGIKMRDGDIDDLYIGYDGIADHSVIAYIAVYETRGEIPLHPIPGETMPYWMKLSDFKNMEQEKYYWFHKGLAMAIETYMDYVEYYRQ